MDSHPPKKKKKKKPSIEQIRNQSTVTLLAEKTKYNLYKAKANQTPLPNTAIQTCLSKKKKPIQRKPNPRPRANQTHSETVTSLVGAARSVARRPRLVIVARPPRLVVVARPPLVIARREGLVANRRRSQIADRCSAASVLSLKVFLSLFLSDSHSLYLKSEMNESVSVSVSLYSLRVTLSL